MITDALQARLGTALRDGKKPKRGVPRRKNKSLYIVFATGGNRARISDMISQQSRQHGAGLLNATAASFVM